METKQKSELIKQGLADYYNENASVYHQKNYDKGKLYCPLMTRQYYIECMVESLALPKSVKILDVGCGPGELIRNLLKQGYDVWGTDISSAMVNEANDLIGTELNSIQKRVSVGDIEAIEFEDELFDVVIASGVIEYQKEDGKSLTEMKRVLKKGGYLILNVTNRYSYINIFINVYRWLKNRRSITFFNNFLKRVIPGLKDSLFARVYTRQHSPRKFDRSLEALGFRKVKHNFFHFSLFPHPLNLLFKGRWFQKISIRMERLSTSGIARFLGGGYLVMARKENS